MYVIVTYFKKRVYFPLKIANWLMYRVNRFAYVIFFLPFNSVCVCGCKEWLNRREERVFRGLTRRTAQRVCVCVVVFFLFIILHIWHRGRRLALPFDIRGGLCEALHFQSIGGFQERGQLLLGYVHLAGVHKLQDRLQVAVRDVLQDDDRVLRGVFLQQ